MSDFMNKEDFNPNFPFESFWTYVCEKYGMACALY